MSSQSLLVDKFRGCMLGGLVGDCLGDPFELSEPQPPGKIKTFITQKLENPQDAEGMLYTDDTEMAKSVAESLLVNNGFNALDMSNRFLKEYQGPHRVHRNYGAFVHTVFRRWEKKDYQDVYDPSREQFNGGGSFGNGGAMRTHPIALFTLGKGMGTKQLIEISRQTAQLTHYHSDGYNGAILLSLAVRWAITADSSVALEPESLLDFLLPFMKELESKRTIQLYPSYCEQLKNIKKCLDNKEMRPEEAGRILGNLEIATKSVPLAIYAFLRAKDPVQDFESSNPFLRTLYLCLAAGGDTDTIASMACSISGSYYGVTAIPSVLYQQCEDYQGISDKAQRLSQRVTSGDN